MTQADTYLAAKGVQVTPPADYGGSIPSGATNITVDTIGFKWARYDFNFGTVAGSGIDASVRESDTSGSGYSLIAGADLPTITTANDAQVWSIVVDCKATKRYHKLLWTFDTMTASPVGVTCLLSAAEDPVWATQTEVSAIV